MSTTVQLPPALVRERAVQAVHAARRMVRRAALAVEVTACSPAGDVQARIEDVVRAGTALEQAEAALAEVAA